MSRRGTVRNALAVLLSLALAVSVAAPALAFTPLPGRFGPPATTLPTVPAARTASFTPPVPNRVVVCPVPSAAGKLSAMSVGKAAPGNPDRVLKVPAGMTPEAYAESLVDSGQASWAEPDRVAQVLNYTATPNDPDFLNADSLVALFSYSQSWWERGAHGGPDFASVWPSLSVDGTAYHARATASQVTVGVIDTGFYMDHPDRGANIVAGKDLFQSYSATSGVMVTDRDVNPAPWTLAYGDRETAAHGTMVASEIAQSPSNGVGGTGAAYDTTVRIYKVQGIVYGDARFPAGYISMFNSAICDAIYAAVADGCQVINLSVGYSGYDTALQAATDFAHDHGVVVVAAAGNSGKEGVYYPAANPHVIGVGISQVTPSTGLPSRGAVSSWGTGLDVLAPGNQVWGPTEPGWWSTGNEMSAPGYALWAGTSMASPLVAAEAALILRFQPDLSPDEVEAVIEGSAVPVPGQSGYDTKNGWGIVNMAAAWAKLKTLYPNLDKPAVSGLGNSAYHNVRDFDLSWPASSGYQVKYGVSVDGAAPTTSAATALALRGLPDGLHTVAITPTSVRNWNAGSTTNLAVIVDTVAPMAPGSFSYDNNLRRIGWHILGEDFAPSRLEFALDSTSAARDVTGKDYADLPVDLKGTHTAYLRVTDEAGNVGPWGSRDFTVSEPSVAAVLTLTAPGTLAWGSSAAVSGKVSDSGGTVAGRKVRLESSTDGGGTWSTVLTATTGADGTWRASWAPARNVLLRASFDGDVAASAGVSPTRSVAQLVYLSTPTLPSRVHHGKSFTSSGYLKPRVSSGSYPVKVAFYRWEKKSGKYQWVLRKTVSAKASNYSSYTRYSVSTSLPYSGSWKAVATYAGNATYAATASGNRALKIY